LPDELKQQLSDDFEQQREYSPRAKAADGYWWPRVAHDA
jgi:hypothetical protein